MKLKKSSLVMILAIVMTLTMAVGGTLAYLTDADSAVNEFTMGNVAIKLQETWADKGTIWPGHAVTKEVAVENVGKNAAYIFATVAIPAASNGEPLIKADFDETKWSVRKTDDDKSYQSLQINEQSYAFYVFQYNTPLEPEATTEMLMTKITLDERVDFNPETKKYELINNGKSVGKIDYMLDSGKVYVNAYAIQEQHFTTVDEAYNAFAGQWLTNKKWSEDNLKLPDLDGTVEGEKEEEKPATAGNATQFKEVMETLTPGADGVYTIEITQSFNLTGYTPVVITPYAGTKEIVINGHGNTLTNMTTPLLAGAFAGDVALTINDLTIEGAALYETSDSKEAIPAQMGLAAFVAHVDESGTVTLNNCHLINSSVITAEKEDVASGTSGLVGYSSGAGIVLKNCSVKNCTITGVKGTGGLIGYTTAPSTIEDCTVENTSITSTMRPTRVGTLIGLDNGDVKATEKGTITVTGNKLNGADNNDKYGK